MQSMRLTLAFAGLGLVLPGCARLEELQQARKQRRAESDFVDAIPTSPLDALRRSLEQQRSFANATRLERGEEGPYPRESALTMAIKHRERDVLELLLEFGADPDRPDGAGETPLGVALATEAQRTEKVALLLEKGADASAGLHHAAGGAATVSGEVLPLLLSKARGAGSHDAEGWMPVHTAARAGNEAALRLLIAKGADVDARTAAPPPSSGSPENAAGQTPLAIVARDRQIAAAATLCALGADPDLQDARGVSARQAAARIAATQASTFDPRSSDQVRHKNMAAFLSSGGPCDALRARRRGGEPLPEAEVLRIANENECEAGWGWTCGRAGWAYHNGEGAPRDAARALALFRKGCEALTPNPWSCGMAGILSVPKDSVEGARWLAKGCETPDPERADAQACTRLGLLYAEGRGVAKDVARARQLFRRACDGKHEAGCANLLKYAG